MNRAAALTDIEQVLLRLGFAEIPTQGAQRVYSHAASDTLIVLPVRQANGKADGAHVVAVRRMLVERGIISEASFEQLLHDVSYT